MFVPKPQKKKWKTQEIRNIFHTFIKFKSVFFYLHYTAADPGFPRRGAPTCKVGGANLLFNQFFPKNCMKNERIWTGRGGARPWRPPLRSATGIGHFTVFFFKIIY